MAGFFYRGIALQQRKEPALSRDLREFFNADSVGETLDRPLVREPENLTPMQILDIARDAHIIDERDGISLVEKLNLSRHRQINLLVADAIDDEPYISSLLNPLLKNQSLAALGLRLMQHATGAQKAFFAVYRNMTDLEVKIPKTIEGFAVKRIHGRYPAEYQAGNHFDDHKTVIVGACALLHLARAVLYNKPQNTTFITVAGDCIGYPTNLEVSLGMTVTQVLERCGLIDDPNRVIIGGSMTGISVIDTDHTLVTPTTRAILAFREAIRDLNFGCIGCGRCALACPQGLNPFYLYRSIKQQRYVDFGTLDAKMCIGCNACSYVCPAKLDLSQTVRDEAQHFRKMAGSIRMKKVLERKKENAHYAAYYDDFLLRRAKIAYKRSLKNLAKQTDQRQKEIQNARRKAEQEAQNIFSQAQSAAQSAHDQAQSAARRTHDTTVADANKQLVSAERQSDQTFASTDLASQKEIAAIEKEALRTYSDTEKSVCRNYTQTLSEAERTFRDAEKQATRLCEGLIKDAQRTLNETIKTPDLPIDAQNKAQAEFQKVQQTAQAECSRTIAAAQKILDAVRKTADTERDSILTRAASERDQRISSIRTQMTQRIASSKTQCTQQIQQARAVHQKVLVDAQSALDATLAQTSILFAKACETAQIAFDLAMKTAKETFDNDYATLARENIQTRQQLDLELAKAMQQNRLMHRRKEDADAAFTGRTPTYAPEDLEPTAQAQPTAQTPPEDPQHGWRKNDEKATSGEESR